MIKRSSGRQRYRLPSLHLVHLPNRFICLGVDRLNSEVLIGSDPLLVVFLFRASVFKLEVLA